MFDRNFSAEGATPQIHKRELPEHNLFIVSSSDETYENDLKELLRGKNTAFQENAKNLEPLSVFVKNTGDRDVLAYKLNWEVKMADGSVINQPRTYFAPAYLMGFAHSDLYDRSTRIIKKGSKRFFTMIPTPLEGDSGASGVATAKTKQVISEESQIPRWPVIMRF